MRLTTNNNLIGSHTDYQLKYCLLSVWLPTDVICGQYDYQLPLRIINLSKFVVLNIPTDSDSPPDVMVDTFIMGVTDK